MKQRKTVSKFYSIASLLLCVLLVLSVFASCESTETANNEPDKATEETAELKEVVRVKKGVLSGKLISKENLELVEIPASAVPEGAISSVDSVVGKYAAIDMVMGEYVFDRMLTESAPLVDESAITYIVVSDAIENAHSKDITAELQKLIDSHPGRTIYFNDGVYTLSSTVYLPTDKEKAVSIRLSNYAVIKAAESWSADSSMIAVGAKDESASTERATNSISGGKFDGSGVVKVGLSVENSSNIFVSNVTFENIKTAVWIKNSADTVNVEGITVKGSGANDSIGIINESSRGVFSTINISNVNIGVKNSGKDNDFRNIAALCGGVNADSVGFSEEGGENIFEYCTAENFTNGYFIKDGVKSVFEACNAYWSKADVTVQNAFLAEGTFNSVITASMARFFDASSENAFIKLTARGSGVVKAPIFDASICDDEAYKTVLSGSVISIK